MTTLINDPEMLETLYWQEGLSMWRIAQRLDCSETAVRNAMVRYNIDRRGSGYNSKDNKTQQNPIYFRTKSDGYEVIRHNYDGESYNVYFHQLLSIAKGNDPHKVFSSDYHVHHKNEIKWDNRPENIDFMTASQHMKHHAEKTQFGNSRKYSDEEMLDWIRSFVAEFGYVPTSQDIDGWPGPTVQAYEYRFDTWKNAINMAGWEVPNHPTDKNGRRIGTEEPKKYKGDEI